MTNAGNLVAIVSGVLVVEVTLLGAAWRVSAWHTRQDEAMRQLGERIERIERWIGIPAAKPRRRRGRYNGRH